MVRKERHAPKAWLLAVLLLAGCSVVPHQPSVPLSPVPGQPPLPPTKPTFEKTFGELLVRPQGMLLFKYKEICLVINPQLTSAESSLPIDYVLLTDAKPAHFSEDTKRSLRKNVKIITASDGISVLQKNGFTQAKAITTGQRIMLKKNQGFLFVSCVQSHSATDGSLTNGYLLEFDNGKNLFVGGERWEEEKFREFVYGLRDDGKEIALAFFPTDGFKKGEEEKLAESVSLIQPKVAVLLPSDNSSSTLNEITLREALKTQLYFNELYLAHSSEKIPF